ncbi:MAG TPA: HEAT repeat domain-containing protein [Planctomycetota bacterium]|nr:HEAT repeat domain-containing protein [Planctomycetota bacterium]
MKRSRTLLVALPLVALAATAGLEWQTLAVRFCVWRIARAGDQRLDRVDALSGAFGKLVLEEIAFDRGRADDETRAVRERALRRLRAMDGRPDDARVARYLREAKGLERRFVYDMLEGRSASETLVAAVVEVLDEDPDDLLRAKLCHWLGDVRASAALPAVRRAATGRDGLVRLDACMHGLAVMVDPENVPVLVRALDDPDEDVAGAAAITLAHVYHEPAAIPRLLRIIEAPDENPVFTKRAIEGLVELRARSALVVLAYFHEVHRSLSWEPLLRGALEKISGVELARDQHWIDWVASHRAELPEQVHLEPRARRPGR